MPERKLLVLEDPGVVLLLYIGSPGPEHSPPRGISWNNLTAGGLAKAALGSTWS